jgi:hypothetical protein
VVTNRPLGIGWTLGLGLALAVGCSGPTEMELVELEIGTPADTILTRYINVPVATWLEGSRWAVVAGELSEAALVGFDGTGLQVLGGTGEAELRGPFAVYRWGDTAWVADWATRRVTGWLADGRFVGSVTPPDLFRGTLPRARDAAGQFYFEIGPIQGPGGRGSRDSASLIRAAPDWSRVDTVARLSPLDVAEVNDEKGRRFERRIFSGTDAWGAFPDGTLWLARVYPNRIDRVAPNGKWSKGPALPDRIMEVSRLDRIHWLLQFPEEVRGTAERLPVALVKPPFTSGFAGPDQTIWLEKSRAAVDSTRTYHVHDRGGKLLYAAVLAGRQARVIAVGGEVLLVAEQYREGVRLMQVRRPAPPVAAIP